MRLITAPAGCQRVRSRQARLWLSDKPDRPLTVSEAYERVARIDLVPVMRLLVEQYRDVWSEACLATAERDYRRFLTLQLLYPGTELVPSRLIDAVWHCHVLDTRKYHSDSSALFGGYLHHNPHFGAGGEEEQQQLQRAFRRTQELWVGTFGSPLPNSVAPECCSVGC